MIRNYIVTGFRAQKRQKWYTILNIFGLTIGLATALFILSYVREDFRWDRFVTKGDRLYRLVQVQTINPETELHTPYTMPAIAPAMLRNISGIESVVRTTGMWKCSLFANEKSFSENYRYADPNLFDLINYPLISGDPETALSRPESIVMTEEVARKFFGDENPMGKTLIIEGNREVVVTGILGKPDTETHFEQNVIVPMEAMLLDMTWMSPDRLDSWDWFNFFTYILLEEGANIEDVNAQLPPFFAEHYDPNEHTFYLQPFFDVHLKSHHGINSSGTNSKLATVNSLILIAGFILLIACINFINMSTAQSVKRAREVGMRKVAGASKQGLIFQFLTESMLIAVSAMVLAAVLIELLKPWFIELSGRSIEINIFEFGFSSLTLIALTVLTGIVSGIYPAFVLSKPHPAQIFKRELSTHKTPWVRRALVIFQFTISIFLLISTVVIYKQVLYLQNKELGYNKEGIFLLQLNSSDFNRNLKANIARIESIPGVEFTTCINKFPGRLGNITGVNIEGQEDGYMVHDMVATPGFEDVFQLELAAGRFFDKNLSTDILDDESGSIIINENAAKLFGWDQPLGKTIRFNGHDTNVIGVVKDFHFSSLHQPIEPMVIVNDDYWLTWAAIRFNTDNVGSMIKEIENIWNEITPDMPFEYKFQDEFYDSQYRDEVQQASIFNTFTGIAIFIACLGLLGLAAYAVNTRSKEISVRKVLGASVNQILVLLSREYFWMVLVASLIASPVAFIFMKKWLDSFAYHTNFSWWVYGISICLMLLIALATVVVQATKAALSNPSKALRHE